MDNSIKSFKFVFACIKLLVKYEYTRSYDKCIQVKRCIFTTSFTILVYI